MTRKRRQRRWGVLIFLIHGMAATSVRGESSRVADRCLSLPRCIAHAEHARTLQRSGKFVAAAEAYRAAYAVGPAPWILFNIARMLEKSQHWQEAASTYRHYLSVGSGEDPTQLQKARQNLAQIEAMTEPSSQVSTPVSAMPSAVAAPDYTNAQPSIGEQIPVYRKWWFWTIIGTTVAAGVAVGTGVGVYAATGPRDDGLVVIRPFELLTY